MKAFPRINPFFLEIIMVLLFLSLSSVAVLQLFSAADRVADRSAELNTAMILAQTAAETVQSAQSVQELDLLFEGGEKDEKAGTVIYRAGYDKNWQPADKNAVYAVETAVTPSKTDAGTLLTVEITVLPLKSGADPIFSLPVKKYLPAA